MRRRKFILVLVSLLVFLTFSASAFATELPAQAAGAATKKGNAPDDDLELKVILHYAGQSSPLISAAKSRVSPSLYKLLRFKINSPLTYVVDLDSFRLASGTDATAGALLNAINTSVETWEEQSPADLLIYDDTNANDLNVSPTFDYVNLIEFGDYPTDGVIAVTYLWYSRATKSLLGFDMLFDTDFNWGIYETDGGSVMDVQNIATHEFGHVCGLGDLYTNIYPVNIQTMFGYSWEGDTDKRTLESGDIAGMTALYK